jgi:hypothetical protein
MASYDFLLSGALIISSLNKITGKSSTMSDYDYEAISHTLHSLVPIIFVYVILYIEGLSIHKNTPLVKN